MENVPFESVVSSPMYAMVGTRPDISHAVGVLSRYISTLGREHWKAMKIFFLVFSWDNRLHNLLSKKTKN